MRPREEFRPPPRPFRQVVANFGVRTETRILDATLIRGGTLVTFDPPRAEVADLLVQDGTIIARGRNLPRPEGSSVYEAAGHVILPGFVTACTRLTADPLPGLLATSDADPSKAATVFHSEESLICAAFAGGSAALRSGVSCAMDLVHAPQVAEDALARVRDVFLTLGLRSVLAYRITEDGGASTLERALAATRTAAVYGGGEMLRLAISAADVESLSDGTLADLGGLVKTHKVPFFSMLGCSRSQRPPDSATGYQRLREAGVLGPGSVIEIGGGVTRDQLDALAESGATIVLGSQALVSGMSPALLRAAIAHGAALGTGASAPDLLAAIRSILAGSNTGPDAVIEDREALGLLAAGSRLQSRIFGIPAGTLEVGSTGDLVIYAYDPSYPLTTATVASHVVHRLSTQHVRAVVVNGRFVVRNGRITTIEETELLKQLRRGALDLWMRATGTPFPGWELEIPEATPTDDDSRDRAAPLQEEMAAMESVPLLADDVSESEDEDEDEDEEDEEGDDDDWEDDDDESDEEDEDDEDREAASSEHSLAGNAATLSSLKSDRASVGAMEAPAMPSPSILPLPDEDDESEDYAIEWDEDRDVNAADRQGHRDEEPETEANDDDLFDDDEVEDDESVEDESRSPADRATQVNPEIVDGDDDDDDDDEEGDDFEPDDDEPEEDSPPPSRRGRPRPPPPPPPPPPSTGGRGRGGRPPTRGPQRPKPPGRR